MFCFDSMAENAELPMMRRISKPLFIAVMGLFCKTHYATAQFNDLELLEVTMKAAAEAMSAMTNDPDLKKLLGEEELQPRTQFDAADQTPTSTQLEEIAQTFAQDPDQTIGAKRRVQVAVGQINLNITTSMMDENARLLMSVMDNLTERQAQQLGQHIDAAIKESLNGLDGTGLVTFVEQIEATGRGGRALDDHFSAIVNAAITGFAPAQP